MKRSIMFSFILVVTAGLMFSGTITVNSPATGAAWHKGETKTISWTSSGCADPNIKINIFRNSIDTANFVEQLTCTGCSSKSWLIPMGYTNGNYVIRIKTEDNTCVGDSGVFTISDPPATGASITVNVPNSTTTWEIGSTHNITWSSTGSPSPNVKINIFRGAIDPANFVEQLTATTASGSKSWNIAEATYTAGTYRVRIKDDPETTLGDSQAFTLIDPDDGGFINPDWGRIKDILRGYKEIQWWRRPGPWPGPNPCLSCPPEFDLGKIRELLTNAGVKEEIGVFLFKGGQKFADLGKFGPSRLKGKGLRGNRLGNMAGLQNKLVLDKLSMENSKMLQEGKGFKLVLMNGKGEVISEQTIILQEQIAK